MKRKFWALANAWLVLMAAGLFAGCRCATSHVPSAVDLNASLSRAAELKQPLVVMIADIGSSRADDNARNILESRTIVKVAAGKIITVLIDVGVSRNRAVAARFHVSRTPLLLCLSSSGIIISRDEGTVTKELLLKRIDGAVQTGPMVDAKLFSLMDAAEKESRGADARFALTDFLRAHHNDAEAVKPLEALAHSESISPTLRVRAWVALARAHLWIAEPEKAHHEADQLISELGPSIPEAQAGGHLMLGEHDVLLKRTAAARKEFLDAIAAAPDSPYAGEASKDLANLPEDGRQKN